MLLFIFLYIFTIILYLVKILFTELRLGLVQLAVGNQKSKNISRAITFIEEAKKKGADIVTLPECFNSPYGTGEFKLNYLINIV